MSPFRFPFGTSRHSATTQLKRRAVRRPAASRRHQLTAERFESRAMLTIVQVSSTLPAGTVAGIGDTIPFQVIYNTPIQVTGSPVANVNVIKASGAQATATYTGPSAGGLIQNFSYTVAPGDTVAQFDVLLSPAVFLVGGTMTEIVGGAPADRTVDGVAGTDPTIADMNPGLRVDGIAPVVPTVAPTVYVNPTAWTAGPWATLHPTYFVISGTAGTTALPAGEVLTVTVNGATYTPTVSPTGAWNVYIYPVGTNPASIPTSGMLAPWSTTNNAKYNVVATVTDAAGNSSTDTTNDEVVIDMDPPALTAVNSTSTGGPDTPPGSYGVGSVLDFYVVYDEPIRVVGTPLLPINVAPAAKFATFVGVVNGNEAHFQYTVLAGDTSPAGGVNVSGTAINLNGGFIEDLAANPAPITPPTAPTANTVTGIVIDTVAPTVTNVTATNVDGTYVVGSPEITITVTFSEVVNVVGGPPQLALNSAGGRVATFAGGSGTNTLSFGYTVQAGDDTPDLDYTAITALSLMGATIRDAAQNNAVLTLPVPGAPNSLGGNKNIVVADQPQVIQVSSPDLPGIYTAGQTVRIRVMFDKNVQAFVGPSPTLSLGTTPAASIATWSNAAPGGYIDGVGNRSTGSTNIMEFTYLVKPGDTTSGAALNYVSTSSLSAGAGIDLSPNPIIPPGVLAADLTLPPLVSLLNVLPNAGIIIGPDTTAPAAPLFALADDTTNAIGNYTTDGITSNAQVNVSGLETLQNGTWAYRYRFGGSPGGAWSAWIPGGPIAAGGTGNFLLPANVTYAAGTIEVRQTDWSGNTSPSGANAPPWNIDTNLPVAPATATITETGPTGSGITNNPLVTVTGLEAGALLQYNATYNSGTGLVNAGAWVSVSPATGTNAFPGGTATFVLPQGSYNPTAGTGVVVRQQDLAGNPSPTPPWTQLTTNSGGTTVTVTLDTVIAPPTMALADDTTPGFAPFDGFPFKTDGVTSNALVNVGNLEVANLAANPPVSGIASWAWSVDGGLNWTAGPVQAPNSQFTLPVTPGLVGGTVYPAGQIQIRETDQAGNTITVASTSTWTIDQTAPTIQAITAPPATYAAGQTVTITVNFGELVYLSAATPTLTLNTGATASLVTPVGSGTSTLQFNYVVVPGNSTAGLAVTAFNLNGAVLADLAGNRPVGALVGAPVTLPGPVIIDAGIKATAPLLAGSETAPGTAVATRLSSMRIVFNTPVRNFTVRSLQLYWNPDPAGTPTRLISLRGAAIRRVGTSGTTYTLTLPRTATGARGVYMLVINGALSNIRSTLNPASAMTTPSMIYFQRV